jgi:hypothetical protein
VQRRQRLFLLRHVRVLGRSGWIRGQLPADPVRLGHSQQLGEHLTDLRFGLSALEQRDRLALHHREDARDRLHLEGLGQLWIGIHVDLAEQDPAAVLLGQRLQQRRQLTAGATPGRPEVEHHRDGVRHLDHLGGEAGVGDVPDECAGRRGSGRRSGAVARAAVSGGRRRWPGQGTQIHDTSQVERRATGRTGPGTWLVGHLEGVLSPRIT